MCDGGRGCWRTLCPEAMFRGDPGQIERTPLILFVDVCVKKVLELGRKFPWPRPSKCPRCRGRLWGHGFVGAYFEGYHEPVLLRRYRCPDCRALVRLRPRGYWSRFQSSIATIRDSLARKLLKGRWRPDLPRSHQRHWLRGLCRQIRFHLPGWRAGLLEAFDTLAARGIAAASRSIQSEEACVS